MLYTSIFGLGVNIIMVIALHYDHFISINKNTHCRSHNHKSHSHEKYHNHSH